MYIAAILLHVCGKIRKTNFLAFYKRVSHVLCNFLEIMTSLQIQKLKKLLSSLAKVDGKVNPKMKNLHCTGFQKISARLLEVSFI